MSNIMDGLYTRVELNNAMITPNEIILLIRDFHKRITELEEANARLKTPTIDRSSSDRLSDEKLSAS